MKKVLFGYRTGSVFGYYPDKEKSVEDVEWPSVLDRSNHSFSFSDDEHDVEINASNIWYYSNDYEGERAVNAEIVLTVYSEVAEILVEVGVDKRMLML